MTKRQLNKQQIERIQAAKRAQVDKEDRQDGLVIVNYYHHADVESTDGKLYHCQLRQHLGGIVAGDRVNTARAHRYQLNLRTSGPYGRDAKNATPYNSL